jgi:cell division inhibitor SepF
MFGDTAAAKENYWDRPIFGNGREEQVVDGVEDAATQPREKISFFSPRGMEEKRKVAKNLMDNGIVIVNCQNMDEDQVPKFVEFLSGVSYSLDGQVEELSKLVYIFTRSDIEVTMDNRLADFQEFPYIRQNRR